MAPELRIQVLRIFADGTGLEVLSVPSIIMGNLGNHDLARKTWDLEDHLGHVPDLRPFRHFIDLRYRCLYDRDYSSNAVHNAWEGKCFVYKCIKKGPMNLPMNEYFPDARAYGDVFVFKLNEFRGYDQKTQAVFGNMVDFATSVKYEGAARTLLREMIVEW